ncbi:MAG: type IV secretion system protein VirB10 [Sedimentibacter sp.]
MSNETENKIIKDDAAFDPMQANEPEKVAETSDHLEDMPEVDSEQKSKGVNKLFWAVAFLLGLIVIFGGVVVFGKNYAAQKEADKAEAQKVAERKESATDTASADISKQKAQMMLDQQANAANATAAASEPVAADGTPNPNMQPPNNQPAPNYVTGTGNYAPVETAPPREYKASNNPGISLAEEAGARKRNGDVLAYTSDNSNAGGNVRAGAAGGGAMGLMPMDMDEDRPQGQGATGDSRNGFANQYQSTAFSSSVATQRKNLTLLLKQGTVIPCVLLTKIDSTYAGQTACQVAKDVYSANGQTLLIERGSKVIGEQRVQLTQGQARVFVLWSRLETPKGVQVQIDSGSTDSLGASGLPARINSQWLKRFGNSILLSLIQDSVSSLANRNNQSGGVSYNSTSDAANEMAVEALKNSINIPPTAHVHQGALLNVFVARDVDFSHVYRLVNRN